MILQGNLVIKSENDNDDNDNPSFFFSIVCSQLEKLNASLSERITALEGVGKNTILDIDIPLYN